MRSRSRRHPVDGAVAGRAGGKRNEMQIHPHYQPPPRLLIRLDHLQVGDSRVEAGEGGEVVDVYLWECGRTKISMDVSYEYQYEGEDEDEDEGEDK